MTAINESVGMRVEQDVPMTTRDGITLVSDIYRPDDDGAHPVLVVRTPYTDPRPKYRHRQPEVDYFVSHGYTVVVQDTRGRGRSEGVYYPWMYEDVDGFDTVEWAAGLPGSNGVVGTTGQSYCGSVQLLMAPTRPPHLRAMCPISGPTTFFQQRVYKRGVFELGWTLSYAVSMHRATMVRNDTYKERRSEMDAWVEDPRRPGSPLTDEAYRHVPLADWGTRMADLGAPYLGELLRHDTDGPYWWATDLRRHASAIDTPMFHVSSWYDAFQYDTLELFTTLRKVARTEEARRSQRLLMGPWGHLQPYTTPTSGGTGDIDFGPEAEIELFDMQLQWFDHFLKGADNGVLDGPPVRLFVMGVNRWRDEEDWPLARARATELFLHSGGGANSVRGDGGLAFSGPSDEPNDTFVFDPNDPVPTCGGRIAGEGHGVRDQRAVENRDDVLVYSGEPVTEALEITGHISAVVFAASTARDTDFTVKLVDVWPNGFAQNLADGIMRARYRDSLTEPTEIEPDRVYRYEIDLGATSHVVLPRHALRVEISSSNFPRHDRNPNTGRSPLLETELRVATQRVFHDGRYPSHILLPVVPG